MNNGTQEKRTRLGDLLQALVDHAELASLEARFEAAHVLRRLVGLVVAFVLALAVFIYLQIALIAFLATLGVHLLYACLGLAGLYGILAGFIIRWALRRDPKAGRPFDATRREMEETVQWIQTLFS